ncbi:solute carrier family 22 member 8-like [Cimex lectularius]|uniref:Major facilitator superfamily (MFS) profile domain-containing protein n=1 Tax=Cimex lectularius TaxID=79782 RepID=A0A8I6RWP7_CIMLE|nr:solute carrier family 22 member 8-like [Cimex lectularius]
MENRKASKLFSLFSFQKRSSETTDISDNEEVEETVLAAHSKEEGDGNDTDIILKTQGNIGCWQTIIVIIMSLFNMPAVFQLASPEVTAADHISCCARPTHLRNISVSEWREISGTWKLNLRGEKVFDPCFKKDLPENATYEELKNYKTDAKTTCTTWDYDRGKTSIISEFNLACTSMPINNLAESVFLIGAAIGDIINGVLADRFGRRRVLMVSQGFVVLTGFIIANSSSYRMYLLCRVVLGYLCSAITMCSFIICLEIVGGRWRGIMSTAYTYSYSFGYITLHLFSEIFPNWVHLQYSITLIAIFLLSIWWLVPESPRWLLTTKNLPELMIFLEMASSFNRLPLLSGIPRQIKNSKPMMTKNTEKVTLPMLFQTKIIRWLSIVCPFPSFFYSVTYNGLALNSAFYSTSLFYSGLSEFCAVTFVLMLNVDNDLTLASISISLSGICCLIGSGLATAAYAPTYAFLFDIVILFARFFSGIMNTTFLTTICCKYPTVIRGVGFGWCHCFANIALCVAANIVSLSEVYVPLPLVLTGFSALCSSLAMFFLPPLLKNTMRDLIEEIEEVDEEHEQSKQAPWPSKTGRQISLFSIFSINSNKSDEVVDKPKPYLVSNLPQDAQEQNVTETKGKGVIKIPQAKPMTTANKKQQPLKPVTNAHQEPLLFPDMDVHQSIKTVQSNQDKSKKESKGNNKMTEDEEMLDDVPYHCTIL